ncbi:nitronate monooxygenase [Tsukamurella soli]|uniref:Nitronate monooxygenase n=1 Tax=Tsukamurella soli TaxID=644556 RepID=A0ABP8J6C5_9ACTN
MTAADWIDRLVLPAIAAPMTGVSGPELVVAACRSGIVGSFPTHNAPTVDALDEWLNRIFATLAQSPAAAPVAANLVVHRTNARLQGDVDCLIRHGVEIVITSVGSPAGVVAPLHAAGCTVLADVATMRHVDRALEAGVDGLILLTAGAGGQTGAANPFAFVRAVRERFDGIVVLAGGITDGPSILAAQMLGADLVYLGTRLIATTESWASAGYRAALVDADLDDVHLTSGVGGIPANVLSAWLDRRRPTAEAPVSDEGPDGGFRQERLLRNRDVWGAGHGVGGIKQVLPVAAVIDAIKTQHDSACERMLRAGPPHLGARPMKSPTPETEHAMSMWNAIYEPLDRACGYYRDKTALVDRVSSATGGAW